MADQNNILKVVGVTFNNADGTNRQTLINELEVGDFVQLIEDRNPKDPNSIAFVNDAGEILGYIGADDPMREKVRRAMQHDNFFAYITAIPGRYPEMKKQYSQGLRVAVGNVQKDGDCVEDFAPLFKEGKRRTDRYALDVQHKGKELRKNLALGNIERDRGALRKAGSRKRRHAFKNGEDISPSKLRKDCQYWHSVTPGGNWYESFTASEFHKVVEPRKNKYISEAEAREMYA